MPTVAPLDLSGLDLDTVVIGKDEVYQTLAHRGRFALVDGVLHFDPEHELIVGYKDIRADDWWADGHVPGRPIFPGALQCEGAAQLCTYDFMHRREDLAGAFVGFAGMNKTRFRGIVEPPCRLVWAGEVRNIRRTMFTYYAQGFVDRKLVFETEIMGVVV